MAYLWRMRKIPLFASVLLLFTSFLRSQNNPAGLKTQADFVKKNNLSPKEGQNYFELKHRNTAGTASLYGMNKQSSVSCSQNNVLNIGFEQGSFSGWSMMGALNLGGSVNYDSLAIGQAAPVATLVSGGTDPATGYLLTSPLGGSVVARLNDNVPSAGAVILETKFRVTPQTRFLKAAFALVFETAGHDCVDNPFFKIEVFNCNSTAGMSEYFTQAQEGTCVGQTILSPTLTTLSATNWRVHCFDFSAYLNSTVSLRITMADCKFVGHCGYGYFDAAFEPAPVGGLGYNYSLNSSSYIFGQNTSSVCSSGGSSIILPPGAASYSCFSHLQTYTTTASSFLTPYSGNLFIIMNNAANNCVQQQKINVTTTPTVVLSPGSGTVCPSSQFSTTVAGAQSYSVLPGLIPFAGGILTLGSPMAQTVYTVTGMNGTNCTGSSTLSLSLYTVAPITVTPLSQSVCIGAPAGITASGASTYTWSNNNTGSVLSLTPTLAGMVLYNVIGRDVNNCVVASSASATLTTNNAVPTLSAIANASICPGDSVYAWAWGNAISSYAWSNSVTAAAQYLKPLVTTVYTVNATTACGTILTKTVQVFVKPVIPFTLAVNAPTAACADAIFTINCTGAPNYTFISTTFNANTSGTGPVMLNSTANSFTVLATNTVNCASASSVITVNMLPGPTLAITPTAPAVCAGQTLALAVTGANTYTWAGGWFGPTLGTGSSLTMTPNVTNNYQVTGAGPNGCSATAYFTVSVEQPAYTGSIVVNNNLFSGTNNTVCLGAATPFTLSTYFTPPGNTYTWNGTVNTTSIVVAPTITTTYTLEVNSLLCGYLNAVKTITVIPSYGPTITATASQTELCVGQAFSVTATGANSYVYYGYGISTNTAVSYSFNYPNNGTISVSGYDSFGCPSQTVVLPVNVVAQPTLNYMPSQIVCPGVPVTLSVTGAASYSWSSGQTGSVAVVAPTASSTTYTVYGYSANSACSTWITRLIYLAPQPTVAISAWSNSICPGGGMLLTASGSANNFTWSTQPPENTATVVVTPSVPTVYMVSETDWQYNCVATASIAIGIYSSPTASLTVLNPSMCSGSATMVAVNPSPPGGIISPATYSSAIMGIGTHTLSYFYTDPATTCTANTSASFTIFPDPCVSVFAAPENICMGQSSTITALPAGGVLSGQYINGTMITPPGAGTYSFDYVYTDANGCGGTACGEVVANLCATSANELATPALKIYPNPFNATLIIANEGKKEGRYKLIDVNGSLHREGTLSQTVEINTELMPKGFYILQIFDAGQWISYKVIKS